VPVRRFRPSRRVIQPMAAIDLDYM
jgi:hypothetical protein